MGTLLWPSVDWLCSLATVAYLANSTEVALAPSDENVASEQSMACIMNMPALEIKGLEKRFGGVVATNGVSLAVSKGSLHALIGPNGAGKTTLIAQLSGELAPDAGQILHHGTDVTHLDMVKRRLACG